MGISYALIWPHLSIKPNEIFLSCCLVFSGVCFSPLEWNDLLRLFWTPVAHSWSFSLVINCLIKFSHYTFFKKLHYNLQSPYSNVLLSSSSTAHPYPLFGSVIIKGLLTKLLYPCNEYSWLLFKHEYMQLFLFIWYLSWVAYSEPHHTAVPPGTNHFYSFSLSWVHCPAQQYSCFSTSFSQHD